MGDPTYEQFMRHLDAIISTYEVARAKHEQFNGYIDPGTAHGLLARSQTVIEHISGKASAYTKRMELILADNLHEDYQAELIVGIVKALKDDLENGFLSSMTELLHSEVFGDYLDMASYLLSEGYKDAAAVIAGSTLEAHLRRLCVKFDIDIELRHAGKSPRPKKASQLNQDLGINAYSLYDQKSVTAWLDLRNSAAHGQYGDYSENQVELMVEGLRDFIRRNPA